jgi:hypothetical protein
MHNSKAQGGRRKERRGCWDEHNVGEDREQQRGGTISSMNDVGTTYKTGTGLKPKEHMMRGMPLWALDLP